MNNLSFVSNSRKEFLKDVCGLDLHARGAYAGVTADEFRCFDVFVHKELNLVVEVDGNSHFSAKAQERDAERDRQMQALGLRIIRVNDGEVRKDPERIASWIIEQAEEGKK